MRETLIDILQRTIAYLERSSGLSPDDPFLAEIKTNLLLMIAALEVAETQPAPVACTEDSRSCSRGGGRRRSARLLARRYHG